MSEPNEQDETELAEPSVTDVPEPDQEETDAEEEADAEQAETPDTEPEGEPEAQGVTQEVWEERFKYVERIFKTYAGKVTDKWEEDGLSLVQFNLDPAAPPGFLDTRNKGRVDDETKAAALAFLGFDTEAGMKPDPYSDLCETCEGWGLVVTGSKVPNQDTRICLDCKGVGYVAKGSPAAALTGNGFDAETAETGQLVPNATGVESPEIESLRMQGYTIIPPMKQGA